MEQSERVRGSRSLKRAALACCAHTPSRLQLSNTLALLVALAGAPLSIACARCALDRLRALRSRLLTRAALSLTHAGCAALSRALRLLRYTAIVSAYAAIVSAYATYRVEH